MSLEYSHTYDLTNAEYKVNININRTKRNEYRIYGKLLYRNGTPVKGIPPLRRSGKSLEEAKQKIRSLIYAVSCKIPENKTEGGYKKDRRKVKNAIDDAVKALLDQEVVFYTAARAGNKKKSWNANTHRTVYTYWLNHGLSELLLEMAESEDPALVLREWRDKLIASTKKHGRSRGTEQFAAQTVDINLYRMNILLGYLREEHPEFPSFDLTGASLGGRAIPEEQIKALPEALCQYIRRELEARLEKEPCEVLGTVLMFDCALRTAEAAGIKLTCIHFYDSYAVIEVMYQEEDGSRIERLKTENAYRYVVSSYWGMTMLLRCCELLQSDPDDDRLLIRGSELSRWIRRLLFCYDEAFVRDAERIEQTNPDRDDNGRPIYDVSAYVLRRNAASRWLNYDGLTHDEIDIMLGHKEKGTRPEVYLMDEAQQREIAVKLERYVYNPDCTKNPAFCPIEVTADSRFDLDAYPLQRIVNVGDTPLRVHIDVTACCPDEEIEAQVPAGSTAKPTARSEKLKPKSRIVMNDNLNAFVSKEEQT